MTSEKTKLLSQLRVLRANELQRLRRESGPVSAQTAVAFECLCLCCVDIVARCGIGIAKIDHPDRATIAGAMRLCGMSETDVDHALALAEWSFYSIASNPPPFPPERAWHLAERLLERLTSARPLGVRDEFAGIFRPSP